jgi:ABC-2 type transport system ATP-binding protein
VRKAYGRTVALNGVSLSVKGGEIYGLLGPNGAGKTTLLKIVVGLLRPDAGSVTVCGFDIQRDRRRALACTGYVPENPVGFDYLTVREFLEFVGALRGLPRERVEESIEKYLDLFGIRDKEHEFMGRLSHGTVQKVLVSAAFMHEPRVLVLDEPISGMDPESQRAFKDEVRRMAASGAAVLISSHMLDTARATLLMAFSLVVSTVAFTGFSVLMKYSGGGPLLEVLLAASVLASIPVLLFGGEVVTDTLSTVDVAG